MWSLEIRQWLFKHHPHYSSTIPVFLRLHPLLGAECGPKALGRGSVRIWGCCWPGIMSSPCPILSQAGRELQGAAQPKREICTRGTINDPELPLGSQPRRAFPWPWLFTGKCFAFAVFIFGFPGVSKGLQLILSFGVASWAVGTNSASEHWVWSFSGDLGFTGSWKNLNLRTPGTCAETAGRDRGRCRCPWQEGWNGLAFGYLTTNHPVIL